MNLIFLEQYSPTSTHLFCLLSLASFFSSSLQDTSPINTLSLSQQPPPVKPKKLSLERHLLSFLLKIKICPPQEPSSSQPLLFSSLIPT